MDKLTLLKNRLKSHDVEVGDGFIKVRPLSREEALTVAEKGFDPTELERYVLSRSVVDPELTEDDVAEWQKASPAGEIQSVFEKILDLSGMTVGAPKAAYKSA